MKTYLANFVGKSLFGSEIWKSVSKTFRQKKQPKTFRNWGTESKNFQQNEGFLIRISFSVDFKTIFEKFSEPIAKIGQV